MSCAVATIFSSLDFLSSSISMANLSRLVAASFSILAPLSSSVSTANLSCLLATTFSSLRFLSNSLLSPRFNLLGVARRCFSWFYVFLFSGLIHSFSFLCSSVSDALSFSFLSEYFFIIHAKAALEMRRCHWVGFNRTILTLSMLAFGPRHDRHLLFIIIYHAKSRLNSPMWGSLRSSIYSIILMRSNKQLLVVYSIHCSWSSYRFIFQTIPYFKPFQVQC